LNQMDNLLKLHRCPTLATPLFLSLGWDRTMQIFWVGNEQIEFMA
jgi:hypothetical protein